MKVYLEQPETILYIMIMNYETKEPVLYEGAPLAYFDIDYAMMACEDMGFEVVEVVGGFKGPPNPDFKDPETFWSKVDKY